MSKSLLISLAILLSACSSNPIKDSWLEPNTLTPVEFTKTLFVAIMDTPAKRRIAEDALRTELNIAKGHTSYPLIADAELNQLLNKKNEVLDQGYQHALVIRWVSSNTELIRQPSTSMSVGRGFWGRQSAAINFNNSTMQSRLNVLFELSLYDLKQDQLIWTANGEVSDPEAMSETIKQLSQGIIKQWQQTGIIAEQK